MRVASLRARLSVLLLMLGGAAPLLFAASVEGQSGRMVKVVVETRQQGTQSRQGVQGSGGVIVQGGTPRARGGLAAEDTTTRTTRSSGVFVLVMDGGAGSMLVAQEVPYTQVAYYHDYALGRGYIAQGTTWQQVGTSLIVRPTILPDKQIRLRLTPSLSYFTPGGGGTIELVEAASRGHRAERSEGIAGWRHRGDALGHAADPRRARGAVLL